MRLLFSPETTKTSTGNLSPPVIDLGDISQSRYLEPLAMLWLSHFFNTGFNGNHAFSLLRK